jgi:urease accessory protein
MNRIKYDTGNLLFQEPDWEIGKHAILDIHASLLNGRTEIEIKNRRIPFQWQGRHYQDHDDEPFLPLITSTGGFVEGDITEFHASTDPDTRLLVTGTSASKFYKCLSGKWSRELVDVAVGHGALFEYHPGLAIPYAHSRVQRYTCISIDPSSKLFAADLLSAGRIHYGEGEIFKFDSLISIFEILIGGKRVAADRLIATDRRNIDALIRLWDGYYHMGIAVAYAPDLSQSIEDVVYDNCSSIESTIIGISRIGNLVIIRVLSVNSWQAYEVIYNFWSTVRPEIAGKPAKQIRTGSSPTGIRF